MAKPGTTRQAAKKPGPAPRSRAPRRSDTGGPGDVALAEYVEHAGLVFERMGMPRIAGKMLGYLLVCDPPHQTQAQLAAALGASKGSISTLSRHMEGMGVVERHSVPGVRVDYLRIPPQAFNESMRRQLEVRRRSIDELTARGLELLAAAPAARTERLRTLRAFHEFMNAEMDAVFRRWVAAQGPAKPARKPRR